MFVTEDLTKVGLGLVALLDGANELIQPPHTIQLFSIAGTRRVKGGTEDREGGIVSLQRHRKRMAVLAAMSERETCGIGESDGCSVDHFGDQSERLQGAGAE